ncbi:Aminopeptidase N, partial [Cyphomyrmex costatus]
LFPCWDERHLKTTFTISVKHPANFFALTNMPLRMLDSDDIEHNFKWAHFYTTPAISTSQVSIILCNFFHVNINNYIILWYRKSFSQTKSLFYAQQVMKNISFHLEYEFGGIKIPKIDHIVIPHFSYNITTKLGFVFHSERELIYHEELGHIMNRIEIARSITRKTAHQWFGDTLGPFWSNYWLHDGLATLFGDEIVAKILNNSQLIDLFVVQSQNEGLYFDSYFDRFPLFNTVSNIESIFNFPRYKVLIFLRMYRDLITDVVFRNGLRTYLHKLTFNSTSVSEFWSILRDLTKEYSCNFISWINFDQYPVVSWKQKNLLWSVLTYNSNSSNSGWWIPIRIMRNTTLPKVIKVWLTPQVQYKYFKGIPNNDAVMFDIQHAAYYRINYESKNWRRIGYYLKSGGYKNISVINCVKLIDDACHFLMTHQLNISIFSKLTRYLSHETNFVAWYPIVKMLERISDMILYSQNDTNFMKFKVKMKELLEDSMKNIGYNEISTEDDFLKNLRRELARWACIFEVPSCMEAAKMKLEESIEYPKQHKLEPEWRKWTYCNAFKILNSTTYYSWLLVYIREFIWPKNTTKNYIEYLACMEDTAVLYETYLFFLFNDWDLHMKKLNSAKQVIIPYIKAFYAIVSKGDKNDKIIQNLLLEHDLKSKKINRVILLILIINNIYSMERYNMILNNPQLIDLFVVQSQNEGLYFDSYFDRFPLFNTVSNIESIFNFPRYKAYYRINYESKNWRRIGYYLKSGGYKNISVINCVKLIDDACHFLMTHQLNISIFSKLTRYLSHETNFVAWYPIVKMLERISDMILYSQNDTNFMKFKVMTKIISDRYYFTEELLVIS